MPTIQKSIRSPASLRGTPKRASWSASVRARASSSVASASSVIARRDLGERRAFLDVENGEPLERQLARDPQRRGEAGAARLQALDQRRDRRAVGNAGRQQRELGGVAAAHALDEPAVRSERNVTNRCHARTTGRERRAGGAGTHRVARLCARLNRPDAASMQHRSLRPVRGDEAIALATQCRPAQRSLHVFEFASRCRRPFPPQRPKRRDGRSCGRPLAPCCGCCSRRGWCCSWAGSHCTG